MAWSPFFNAGFVEPIIDNVLTILERDSQAALTWANGGTKLPDFVKYRKAPLLETHWPCVTVTAIRSDTEDDGLSQIGQQHFMQAEIELTGKSSEEVTDALFKYVRAVDSILRTASYQDFFSGMSYSGGETKQVTSHDYSDVGYSGERGQFFKAAIISFNVTLVEAK